MDSVPDCLQHRVQGGLAEGENKKPRVQNAKFPGGDLRASLLSRPCTAQPQSPPWTHILTRQVKALYSGRPREFLLFCRLCLWLLRSFWHIGPFPKHSSVPCFPLKWPNGYHVQSGVLCCGSSPTMTCVYETSEIWYPKQNLFETKASQAARR